MHIPVIFEHSDFLIINKPPGIGVHQENEQIGVVELIKQQLHAEQLWLVHRLDKVTSGCLILAKSAQAAAQFGELFSKRTIDKYYLAISDKKPNKKQGAIVGDMAKSRNGTYKLLRTKQSPAKSQFFSKGLAGNRAFLLKPSTGKTHQLRVALKSLGAPILGDTAYGGTTADRTYLHAFGLVFSYNGEPVRVSTLPETGEHFQTAEFSQVVTAFSPVWEQPFP